MKAKNSNSNQHAHKIILLFFNSLNLHILCTAVYNTFSRTKLNTLLYITAQIQADSMEIDGWILSSIRLNWLVLMLQKFAFGYEMFNKVGAVPNNNKTWWHVRVFSL